MSIANKNYTVQNNDLTLDGSEKKYTLKIRDLPREEKPREKLIAQGPASLSTPELLAAVLNVGTKKEEVLTMASRVLKDYGEKSIMNQTDAEAMSKDLDIPLSKAVQIVACAELGRRFFEKKGHGTHTIRTPKDVFEYLTDIRTLPKEILRGIYLNAHYKVIHDEVISIGTVDSNIIHPREVFKPAIEYSAAAVVLAHNHPSGEAEASDADIEITKQIQDAGKLLGIDLIDHVVITKDSYHSIID